MASSYPDSAKSFAPIVDGVDYPQATQINQAYDEITAVEQALVSTGVAHNLFPDSTANARTLGTSSKYWGLSYLAGLVLPTATELTIAAGAVTVTQGYHRVDTEADAAADDLITLTPGSGVVEGMVVVLRAENVARVVTLKTGGNLTLASEYALNATSRTITLLYDGSAWKEIARTGIGAETAPTITDGSGAALSLTTNAAAWAVKLSGMMFVGFDITYPATADGSNAQLVLPTSALGSVAGGAVVLGVTTETTLKQLSIGSNSMVLRTQTGGNITNATMSGDRVAGVAVYRVAT